MFSNILVLRGIYWRCFTLKKWVVFILRVSAYFWPFLLMRFPFIWKKNTFIHSLIISKWNRPLIVGYYTTCVSYRLLYITTPMAATKTVLNIQSSCNSWKLTVKTVNSWKLCTFSHEKSTEKIAKQTFNVHRLLYGSVEQDRTDRMHTKQINLYQCTTFVQFFKQSAL